MATKNQETINLIDIFSEFKDFKRIDKQHGVHTIEHAEAIGLGTRKYKIVNIDK